MEEGFNINTGYVYLALDNGITIASCFGQEVEFIVFNYDTGQEDFFYSVEELNEYIK
jgi:hypothetical protein